jgi:hypothetical protein
MRSGDCVLSNYIDGRRFEVKRFLFKREWYIMVKTALAEFQQTPG